MYNGAEMTKIHGMWNNIYGWGVGFYSLEKANNWFRFWNNWENYKKENDVIFFDVLIRDDTPYLVSTYGSIFVHPMDFTAIIYRFDKNQIEELTKICNDVAKCCDSEFILETEKGVWNRV